MYLRFVNFIILPLFFCVNIANAADSDMDNSSKILFKLEGFGIIHEIKNQVTQIQGKSYTIQNQHSKPIIFQYEGQVSKIIHNIKGGTASLTTFIAKHIALDIASGVSVYDVNTADISKNIKVKDIAEFTAVDILALPAPSGPRDASIDKYLFFPISGMLQIHWPTQWFSPYFGVGYSGNFKLTNLNMYNPDLIRTAFGVLGVVGVNIELPKNIIVSASLKYNSHNHGIDFFYKEEQKYTHSASTRNIIESLSFSGGLGIKL